MGIQHREISSILNIFGFFDFLGILGFWTFSNLGQNFGQCFISDYQIPHGDNIYNVYNIYNIPKADLGRGGGSPLVLWTAWFTARSQSKDTKCLSREFKTKKAQNTKPIGGGCCHPYAYNRHTQIHTDPNQTYIQICTRIPIKHIYKYVHKMIVYVFPFFCKCLTLRFYGCKCHQRFRFRFSIVTGLGECSSQEVLAKSLCLCLCVFRHASVSSTYPCKLVGW